MNPLRKFYIDSVSQVNVLKLTSSLPIPVSKGVWQTDLFKKIGKKSSSLSNYWQKMASNCMGAVLRTLQYLDTPKISEGKVFLAIASSS